MLPKGIKGIYIFKSYSGITLFSKKTIDIQEDFLSAFMSAIREFFANLSLGGLSTFSTELYSFYLSSVKGVCTVIIVDLNNKSDKYFNLSYDICLKFYYQYQNYLKDDVLHIPGIEDFENTIDDVIQISDDTIERQNELIKLYELTKSNELKPFNFINEEQLYSKDLFVAVNIVTKKIYVVENAEYHVSGRKIYMANKEVISLNQLEYKSDFDINNLSDIWDLERITGVIKNVLTGATVNI